MDEAGAFTNPMMRRSLQEIHASEERADEDMWNPGDEGNGGPGPDTAPYCDAPSSGSDDRAGGGPEDGDPAFAKRGAPKKHRVLVSGGARPQRGRGRRGESWDAR